MSHHRDEVVLASARRVCFDSSFCLNHRCAGNWTDPRTICATGQLLVFFPTDVTVEVDDDDFTDSPAEEADSGRRSFPLRVSDAFGSIAEPDQGGEYQETDEALQLSTLGGIRRVSRMRV